MQKPTREIPHGALAKWRAELASKSVPIKKIISVEAEEIKWPQNILEEGDNQEIKTIIHLQERMFKKYKIDANIFLQKRKFDFCRMKEKVNKDWISNNSLL
jgi:hypothetical protein